MRLSDFDYELPSELIAQEPAAARDGARLLVHDARRDATEHLAIGDLEHLLVPGDVLVVNDTRVLPSRLFARRASGGRVELLLLEPLETPAEGRGAAERWSALVNPARKLHPGERLEVEGGLLSVRMVERPADASGRPAKEWTVALTAAEDAPLVELLARSGHVPLPPYIRRRPGRRRARHLDPGRPGPGRAGEALGEDFDRRRYQTVFAARDGAVAAPTAGLHFTPELLGRLEQRGVERVSVTLHVGHGTFQPIEHEDVERHVMHSERFELGDATARAVNAARAEGRRVVCVGTTSVRVLESCAGDDGRVEAQRGRTRLFLRPGSPFRVVDAVLTNFHLPRSSLLLLVCAFIGRERCLALYREAVERRYRFFSYGDAMFLIRG